LSTLKASEKTGMSNGNENSALTDDEAMKFILCESHVGTKTLDFQMEQYVWKRRNDGIYSFLLTLSMFF
jgi:ribosomal protein S2